MKQNWQEYEPFLRELCAIAAAEALPRFRTALAVESKGAVFDPVTEADRAAEAAVRRAIAARFPDHGLVGEEWGEERAGAALRWVIDPVDGTRGFVAGLPLWTTLIALECDGVPVLGAVAAPVLGEVFVGGPGLGARLYTGAATRALRTRHGVDLADAIVATTDAALFADEGWARVAGAARLARYGADAYAMALVAAGTIDAVVEVGLKPWDVAGPRAVVEGAGGVVECLGPGAWLFAGDAALAGAVGDLMRR